MPSTQMGIRECFKDRFCCYWIEKLQMKNMLYEWFQMRKKNQFLRRQNSPGRITNPSIKTNLFWDKNSFEFGRFFVASVTEVWLMVVSLFHSRIVNYPRYLATTGAILFFKCCTKCLPLEADCNQVLSSSFMRILKALKRDPPSSPTRTHHRVH